MNETLTGIADVLSSVAIICALLTVAVIGLRMVEALWRCARALEDQATPRLQENLRLVTAERDKLQHNYARIQKKYTQRCKELSTLKSTLGNPGGPGADGGGREVEVEVEEGQP